MKARNICIVVLILILVLGSSVGMTFLLRKNNELNRLVIENKTTWKVEETMETIGKVKRKIPSGYSSEGMLEVYPTYNNSLTVSAEDMDALYSEDKLLRVSSDTYDAMDADGNLYLDGEPIGRKLYRHIASKGMYLGDVSDSQSGVIERVTICPSEDRNYITGIFAPAGEVIKIEISAEDLSAVGELIVSVGQCTHRNLANSINQPTDAYTFKRMPNMVNIFTVNGTTTYVGNYLGGPIYLKAKNLNVEYSVKISGGVKYPVYIHGYTTEEDIKAYENYSAPYFDFELQGLGVRHSGPKRDVDTSFENLYNCGELWKKICMTSRQVPSWSNKSVSVGFLYEPYVAAGAACAFTGNNIWVNAPCDWVTGGLNYRSMTESGFWGTIHEFNHHFQSFGIGPYIEVTNNAVSLLSYVSYTNISSKRTEDSNSLQNWARYTNPIISLKETINSETAEQSALNIYADILHSFGVETFILATQYCANNYTVDGWYEALCKATHYDMSYYFEELLGHTISDNIKAKYSGDGYPIFVPVANLYQTGRNWYNDGEEQWSSTVRPFVITKGEEKILDFDAYTVLPNGFTFDIVSVSSAKYGTLNKVSDKVYKYIPSDGENVDSFVVEIALHHESISTPNVKLSIALDFKDPLPTRTKYIYSSKVYSDCDEAVSNNFEGFESKNIENISTTFMNGIGKNQIGVVEGKIYIEDTNKYTICLRAGRGSHALYISYDGINYSKEIAFDGTKNTFEIGNGHTITLSLNGGTHLYYRAVTISDGSADAYTELGWTTSQSTPVSIPSGYLYHISSGYEKYNFVSEELFTKKYTREDILYTSNNAISSVVSVNQEPWDDTTVASNMLDGNPSTFFHTARGSFVSADNPCEITFDVGEENIYNNLYIVNRTINVMHMPITFKLYGGKTLDSMNLLGDYENITYSGNTLSVTFPKTAIRYYKIVITNTKDNNQGGSYNRYVSIAEINLRMVVDNVDWLSCDEMEYYGFSLDRCTLGTFGHIIKGKGNIQYTFEGKDFILYTRNLEKSTIRVTIDGKSQDIEIDGGNMQTTMLAKDLKNKSHTIKIKVLSGTLRVDSIGVR